MAKAKNKSRSSAYGAPARTSKPRIQTAEQSAKAAPKPNNKETGTNLGKVYWGKTSCIERDTKPRRRYVVVSDNSENVKVSKLKAIKTLDAAGKNANPHLVEIDHAKYPKLTKRTGVHDQVFKNNRRTRQKLWLGKGNGVFDENSDFVLDAVDYAKVSKHVIRRDKKKKG